MSFCGWDDGGGAWGVGRGGGMVGCVVHWVDGAILYGCDGPWC